MRTTVATFLCVMLATTTVARAETPIDELPYYLHDRGTGIPTSMFGTYVEHGELLVYPFVEHYLDHNAEYSPQELGHGLDEDYRGEYEAAEYLIFLGYGFTRDLSLEIEAAYIYAEIETSPQDPTGTPDKYSENGLGDVQTQLNWMWARETAQRPGFFSYGEVVFPFQKDRKLIGTSNWEFKLGTGMVRGFHWGTTTLRAAVEYNAAENIVELGEMAVEYLKRVNPLVRLYGGVEGTQDEVELITELQLHVSPSIFFKINNAFGLTSKATDYAPEFGFVMRF